MKSQEYDSSKKNKDTRWVRLAAFEAYESIQGKLNQIIRTKNQVAQEWEKSILKIISEAVFFFKLVPYELAWFKNVCNSL